MDEMAIALKMDPVEFRRINDTPPGSNSKRLIPNSAQFRAEINR
jgi:CO/xanthine dehydrogenase Mo-binding subunit